MNLFLCSLGFENVLVEIFFWMAMPMAYCSAFAVESVTVGCLRLLVVSSTSRRKKILVVTCDFVQRRSLRRLDVHSVGVVVPHEGLHVRNPAFLQSNSVAASGGASKIRSAEPASPVGAASRHASFFTVNCIFERIITTLITLPIARRYIACSRCLGPPWCLLQFSAPRESSRACSPSSRTPPGFFQ